MLSVLNFIPSTKKEVTRVGEKKDFKASETQVLYKSSILPMSLLPLKQNE